MSVEFEPIAHKYMIDGRELPSVTQCINRLNDFSMIPADVLERKRQIGTAAHEATALYDNTMLDWSTVDDAVMPYLQAWVFFCDETGFTPTQVEQRVYSKRYDFAGTLDRNGLFSNLKKLNPDEEVMLDIKCTAALMPAVGPQTAAYLAAHNEGRRKKIKKRFCALLKPNGRYELEPLTENSDLTVFLACLTIRKWEMLHG